MLEAIAEEFSCELQNVPFVGDSLKDLQVGLTKGCLPILVRTGKGASTEAKLRHATDPGLQKVRVFDNLSAVSDFLLDQAGEPLL
jgi:D-glycero-D-manno-heptose 1,7-bisphosphate phosphatase